MEHFNCNDCGTRKEYTNTAERGETPKLKMRYVCPNCETDEDK